MKHKHAAQKRRRLRRDRPRDVEDCEREEQGDIFAPHDPVSMAERRAIELIKKRERVLAGCKTCAAREDERFRYAMALRRASEEVFEAIKLWQRVRFSGDDLDFAWGGHASYENKMHADAQTLSSSWNVPETAFVSWAQQSSQQRHLKAIPKSKSKTSLPTKYHGDSLSRSSSMSSLGSSSSWTSAPAPASSILGAPLSSAASLHRRRRSSTEDPWRKKRVKTNELAPPAHHLLQPPAPWENHGEMDFTKLGKHKNKLFRPLALEELVSVTGLT